MAFGVALASCRHHDSTPAPAASAAAATRAAGRHFTLEARGLHFVAEKKRAEEIWAAKPTLPECTKLLHETGDAELCNAAGSALSDIEALSADAPSERILPVLGNGSLALARLSQRARYQSLTEISQRRVTADAGAPPAASGSAIPLRRIHLPQSPFAAHQEHPAIEQNDGPAAQFLAAVLRLERDTLRNLGAYLEYSSLTERRAALGVVKQLRETRPQWQQLDRLIREAMLLESDPSLKQELSELAASALPRGNRLGQPTVSK
ncbi:MAG: hypothetical protein ABJB12_05840 [Pseudomonadota bacterium]